MDFLRLFPSSSSTANDHCQQGSSPQKLLFCAYRNLGLLCHSNGEPNKLHLVVVAPASPTAKTGLANSEKTCILFKRITSIVLSPKLPENVQFVDLIVNASGCRAALIGCRMIFVVELDTDFWHRTAFDGPDCVDHLRPEYYAKCDLLHVGLFVRKFPPSILRVRWFEPDSDSLELFSGTKPPTIPPLGSLMAVLCSDNIVRLYDVSTAVDCPLVQLDFTSLLPDKTPDESEASGDEFGHAPSALGFIIQLVSFDFGPPQLVDGNNRTVVLGSLLALDSNGQLYAALFSLDGIGPCSSPKGPLTLVGFPIASQQRLLCSALDLLHIRHPLGAQNFSLWAMASADGLLTHFTLLIDPKSFDEIALDNANGMPLFQLFAVDCVEIGTQTISSRLHHAHDSRKAAAATLKSISRLQKIDFGDDCSAYLVIGQSDVFRVELASLVDYLWLQAKALDAAAKSAMMQQQQPSPTSCVHQLLMFADCGEAPSIGSVACVQKTAMGTSTDEQENQQRPKQQQLVAAECSFGTKMGRKSAFLATLVSCVTPPSLAQFVASQPHQQPQQNRNAINNNKKLLLADDVRALLAQQQTVSAAHYQLPQSLPAAVHFDNGVGMPADSADNNEALEQQLAQLQQRASHLSLVQQSVDQVLLQGQMPARAIALDYALKRSTELLCSLQAVECFRQSATQRLTTIFHQLNELKAKLRQRQQYFRVVEQRIVRIAQSMHSLMSATSSDAEQTAAKTMKQMEHKLRTCAEETAKLGVRIRAHRHALCAGGRCSPSSSAAFTSSPLMSHQQHPLCFVPAPCPLHASHSSLSSSSNAIPAQLFMLLKNGRECAKLREMVDSLGAQLLSGTTTTAP